MKSLERLIETWKREDIDVLPPADESQVIATLDALGKPYSTDVVKVFCLTGGMDRTMDLRCLSLWPLERVRQDNDARQATNDIAFADVLIDCFWYEFHFEDSDRSSVYGGYERRRLAESVEEFFALCLDDPQRLDLSV